MKSTFYREKETKEKLCEFIKHAEQLSMGSKCKEFEEKFSEYQGRKYSVLFNSGSSANLALIQALINLGQLKEDDNVGFSALTWATNVMPLIQLGLSPIPIDISLKNLNVNLENIKSARSKMKAIFITNLLGFCGDLDKIKEYCEKEGILLLEDNCESLGSKLGGEKLGNFGLASTFSFFVGHHLSTIEGGVVCTNDKDLYDMLLMVRAHGWSRNLDESKSLELKEENHINQFYDRYSFYSLGYNLRPTEITGFIGLEQLKFIDEMNRKREQNFKKFYEIVKKNNFFPELDLSHMSFVSNFAFPIVLKNKGEFELLKNHFEKEVEIRPIVGGDLTLQPFFRGYLKEKGMEILECPNSQRVHQNGFYFPNNPELTSEEISAITKLLNRDSL